MPPAEQPSLEAANGILPDEQALHALVKDYLRLGPNLGELYEKWSHADPNFKKRAPRFTGIRILKQDAWEALLGFICSSNNNISRISQMVNNLCLHYGKYIGEVDGIPFHDFPTPESLTQPDVETRLRQLGFGYRAKYIAQTASIIVHEKPQGWLEQLRNTQNSVTQDTQSMPAQGRPGYRAAHEALLELQGVGPKVADCVCLMGLGWLESVPVDTHVWQIATRDYRFGKGKHKSLTKATYDAIGDHFRGLWGQEAGWAHSVLFAADLRTFSERLTTKIEVDIKEVKIEEENGVAIDQSVTIKREYELDVKDEKEAAEAIDTPRAIRAKRRKL